MRGILSAGLLIVCVVIAATAVAEHKQRQPKQAPVRIEEEPYHHVLLKNEFIEVIRAKFAPGESTLFHTHSYDNAGVMLSKDTTTDQLLGKLEGPPETTQAGEVWAVQLPDGKPYTHRVHNVGDTTRDVFLVQFLQEPRNAPAPPVATVAAENPEARVYNWLLAQGATSAMHTHERPYLIVAATLLGLKITTADGKSFAEKMKPGDFHWVHSKVTHTLTNEGVAQGQIVEIELK